jgi:hypothetical protein
VGVSVSVRNRHSWGLRGVLSFDHRSRTPTLAVQGSRANLFVGSYPSRQLVEVAARPFGSGVVARPPGKPRRRTEPRPTAPGGERVGVWACGRVGAPAQAVPRPTAPGRFTHEKFFAFRLTTIS